jgi:MFS family permease
MKYDLAAKRPPVFRWNILQRVCWETHGRLAERGRYQGLFGAVFGVSTVIGPLIGGYFVEQRGLKNPAA